MEPSLRFIPRLIAAEAQLAALRTDLTDYFESEAHRQPLEPVIEPATQLSVEAVVAPVTATWADFKAGEYQQPDSKPKQSQAEYQAERTLANARLEALIAGRGFYAVGLLLVFLAAAFFLKIAFDNWIGPAGRVGLGLATGLGVIVAALRVKRPDFQHYADGLIALGFAIELVALYAATTLYAIVNSATGFATLATVIGALSVLSYTRKSQMLALCAAVGGFLTPPVIGVTSTAPFLYAGYLMVFDIALATLAYLRKWDMVSPVLLLGTISSYSLYLYGADGASPLLRTIIATIFYIIFALIPNSTDTKKHSALILNLVSAGWLTFTVEGLLGSDTRLMAASFASVAATHFLLAAKYASRQHLRIAYGFVTLTVCNALGGASRDITLVLEALSLYHLGIKQQDTLVRFFSATLLATATAAILNTYGSTVQNIAIANPRFLSISIASLAMMIISRIIDKNNETVTEFERTCNTTIRIVGHALIICACSLDAWDVASHLQTTIGDLPQVFVSITWTASAALLIALGFRSSDVTLRWEGLVLISAVATKVICIDLASQDLVYRVISALVVGIVAIAVAAQYQGRIKATETEKA